MEILEEDGDEDEAEDVGKQSMLMLFFIIMVMALKEDIEEDIW